MSINYNGSANPYLKALGKVSLSPIPDNNTMTMQKENHVNSASLTFVAPFYTSNKPNTSPQSPTYINNHQFPQLPPIANAGANQNVTAGSTVILNGSNSRSPGGIILAYSWKQMPGGSGSKFSGVNTPVWEFTAPNVTSNTLMPFQLNVTDNLGQIGTAFVNVLDKPHSMLKNSPVHIKSPLVITTVPSSKLNSRTSTVNIPSGHRIKLPLTPPLIH